MRVSIPTAPTLVILLLSSLTVVSSADYKKKDLPNTLNLIYPNYTLQTGSPVVLGLVDITEYFGVYRYVSISYDDPNGNTNPVLGLGTNVTGDASPTASGQGDCRTYGGNSYTGTSYPLNQTGTYKARWEITWTFPSYLNTSFDPPKCIGIGSSENFIIEKVFNVSADASAGGTEVTKSPGISATISAKPTGVVYQSNNGGEGSSGRAVTHAVGGLAVGILGAILTMTASVV